ncbi:MAG TPA: carboxypeptidase regulatory-like domain-containing protein, partial [Terriglobales bacterium]
GASTMEVATNVTPDKDLTFRVAGTGTLPETQPQGGGQQQAEGPGAPATARPGGGLGNPEGTPDPLEKYRWPILVVCLGALVFGGLWVVTKNQGAQPARAAVTAPAPMRSAAPGPSSAPTLLLQALKEELFQLELDRQQGKISEADYATAKAALDKTLQRAIARSQQAASN